MTDGHITLMSRDGAPLGRLQKSVMKIVTEAEEVARGHHLSKSRAISQAIADQVRAAGYELAEGSLAAVTSQVERVRRGERVTVTAVVAATDGSFNAATLRGEGELSSESEGQRGAERPRPTLATLLNFFEVERVYPDDRAQVWYERLVGLDDHKANLLIELEMLLYPKRLTDWSRKHHTKVLRLCELQRNRVPLVLLEGDVGTGKTALAETIGDALARRTDGKVYLLKINTQVRGTGQVGEMTDLIVQAFLNAEARARSVRPNPVLVLIDEADALASSREVAQMHHEDRAGLNTLLQRLDNLRLSGLPLAVLFATNRPDALDPAVRRRAALVLRFERPNGFLREQILCSSLPEIQLGQSDLEALVKLTGEDEPKNRGIPFTASDITDRLLPAALRVAFREARAITPEDLIRVAGEMLPTPRFGRDE